MRGKFLTILVVLGLVLAACAAPTPEVVEKEVIVTKEVPVTVEVEKEVVVEKPVVQTVEVVLPAPEVGKIIVGINAEYPPFEMVDEAGNIVGFDPDLMAAIAEAAGFEYEWVNTRWDGIFMALASGEFDAVMSAATITEERAEVVDFSAPYFNAGQMIAVRADETEIKTDADLAGKKVGVQLGTTGDIWLTEETDAEVMRYDENTLAFQALAAGDVDAAVADSTTAIEIVKANPEMNLKMLPGVYTDEYYGIAVNKDRPEVLAAINSGLATARGNGSYDAVYDKWFGVEEAVAPEGKTFIFGRGGDSVQLDPAVVTDGESFRVTGQVLEPLFQYEDGGTAPIPALATGFEASADSKEWTIFLREGVKFHDGTPFNADAVVLNFERQWKTDHPLHFESQVYEYWEYMFNGFDDDCLITDIEAVDDLTVKITLREPLAPLLANLAMDIFAISSPAALEKYGADYGMPTVGCVGTGPFKFVEWVEDDHITVDANMDYWGGAPTIGRIIWRVIPDDSARYLALKAGDIHALEQANVEDLKDAEADPNLYVKAIGLNTGYLAFNYHIKEFQDPKVREAVFHAIDREALKDAFYGDYGQVASTFLHPSMWGCPEIEDWTYDPDLSRQLLAEAGFPDGLKEVTNEDTGEVGPLKFYYMPVTRFYYPSPKEIGEAMAADLAKVGIETELYLEGDWAAYLGARREGRLYGLYQLGWGGDNGDPDNFLNYFFGGLSGTGQVKEPDAREGWYANQEVADLLYQAAIEPDQAKRAPLYEEVERLLHEDRARLWVIHNDTPRVLSAKVSGFQVQPVGADKYERVVIAD
jgi:peptide/nickel transport system substrate-binding protein